MPRTTLFMTLGGALSAAVDMSAEAGNSSVAIVREDGGRQRQYWIEEASDLDAAWDDAIVCTVEAPDGPRRWNAAKESAHV